MELQNFKSIYINKDCTKESNVSTLKKRSWSNPFGANKTGKSFLMSNSMVLYIHVICYSWTSFKRTCMTKDINLTLSKVKCKHIWESNLRFT